jgi:cytochrome P450
MYHLFIFASGIYQFNCRVLIFGAQDTTSSAMSRMLHMLSTHLDVQMKVRDELKLAIRTKRAEGHVSGRQGYDDVMSLPWLDAVVRETLRL